MQRLVNLALLVMFCTVAGGIFTYFWKQTSGWVEIKRQYAGMRKELGSGNKRYALLGKARHIANLEAGDIVAYQLPGKDIWAARIIAKHGQRIAIRKGKAQVDGKRSSFAYRIVNRNMDFPEFPVPIGCVYIMYDEPSEELDSVELGPIPLRFILGKIKK